MNKRFEASSDTRFMAQLLSKAKPGDTVTYEELSEAIGRDVRAHAKAAMFSALRIALREGLVFEAETNIGYRRLTDSEIVRTQGVKALNRASHAVRNGATRVSKANYESLSNDERIQHNAQLSVLGAVGQMTKPKVLERAASEVKKNGNKELPVGSTLKLFVS